MRFKPRSRGTRTQEGAEAGRGGVGRDREAEAQARASEKAAGPADKESILTKYHSFLGGPNSAEIGQVS